MSYLKNLLNLSADEENKEKVLESIQKNIAFRGSSLWILACAILIASIGLNVNSTAVIIGAMLISPLMGPIVGAGFALATFDFELLKKCGKNLLIATLASLLVSFLYFYLSPFKEVQSELLSRTSPTIYDVLIAFIGGIVGAVSITRVEKGNPIPGVAIATALMPPLCTAGFGLATGEFSFFLGAFYLYSINCFFIGIATFIIIKYLKYTPKNTGNEVLNKKLRQIISVLTVLIVTPSLYLAYVLFQEKKFTEKVQNFINTNFVNEGNTVIYQKINYNTSPKTIELAFLVEKFDTIQIKKFNDELKKFDIDDTELIIKQNTSNLKSEILSEIDKSKIKLSEKDLKIKSLTSELNKYKLANKDLTNEIRVLFPEIEELSLGKMSHYTFGDSIGSTTAIIYTSHKEIDENKFSKWMKTKLKEANIIIMKK